MAGVLGARADAEEEVIEVELDDEVTELRRQVVLAASECRDLAALRAAAAALRGASGPAPPAAAAAPSAPSAAAAEAKPTVSEEAAKPEPKKDDPAAKEREKGKDDSDGEEEDEEDGEEEENSDGEKVKVKKPKKGKFVGHDVAIGLAKDCLQSGDFSHAIQILEGIVKQDPTCFEAVLQLGFVADVRHDTKNFERWVEKAIEMKPEHAQAWIYRAMCRERKGDYQAARSAYQRAKELDLKGPYGKDAASQIEMLNRNMGCPLIHKSSWDDAAPKILAQRARKEPFHLDSQYLVPQRPAFRSGHWIRAWDDALSPDLLKCVRESIDDVSMYLQRNPKHARTFWLPRGTEPKTAIEVAGRVLVETLLGIKPEEFVGLEWWCKHSKANIGAHFHYDMAINDGSYWRPTYSSVLYLSDDGGPTVVLDQASDLVHAQWPEVPQEGYAVMPRVNRWMTFPGELRHGMVPVDDSTKPRYVLLFNFWTTHQPSAPNCQVPDLSNYWPHCRRAPTSKYIMKPDELEALAKGQRKRQVGEPGGPVALPIETLESPAHFEWSSTFGELPLAMPMPSLRRMRQGPRDAALLHLPWRLLASELLQQPSADGRGRRGLPLPFRERLPLYEEQGDVDRLHRRASHIRAWLGGAFLQKARSLAEAELTKAVEKNFNECKLALTSLEKYIRNELKIELSSEELNGAYYMRHPPCVESEDCDAKTLQEAFFDHMKAHVREWCKGCDRTVEGNRDEDPHHGLILRVVGLAVS